MYDIWEDSRKHIVKLLVADLVPRYEESFQSVSETKVKKETPDKSTKETFSIKDSSEKQLKFGTISKAKVPLVIFSVTHVPYKDSRTKIFLEKIYGRRTNTGLCNLRADQNKPTQTPLPVLDLSVRNSR
jgi:hypothetical protein